MEAALADHLTAPIDARLRAVLVLLEKLTVTPAEVGPADIRAARAAGASSRAIEEAIHVCAAFSLMSRLADALDFELSDERALRWNALILSRLGYRAGILPG